MFIVLTYFCLRYKKLGWKKIIAKTIIISILAELLLYSSIAITRIPFGRIAIACGIGLYVIIIFILTYKFENQREKYIAQDDKQ